MTGAGLCVAVDVREWRRGTSTGIARHLFGFLSWCAARPGGHRFLLVGNQETEFRLDGDALDPVRLAERNRFVWDQLRLPALLRRERVDVFLSPYYKLPLRAGCPVVVTVHDLIPLHFGRRRRDGGRLAAFLRRRWMGFLIRRADQIVTDSNHSRDDLMATLGLRQARIRVVPIGLAPTFDHPPSQGAVDRALERHGLRPGYVLHVGRHAPHKNVDLLLEAWNGLEPELRLRHPLILAGEGAERMVPREDLRALGYVDDEDLPGLYAGARVFAFPSRYEGFGLPPLEAMACGTAVICSDTTSLPEICGDAALLLPPDAPDAWSRGLRQLLTDSRRRATLERRGRRRAEIFRLDRTAPQLLEVLEETARDDAVVAHRGQPLADSPATRREPPAPGPEDPAGEDRP